MPIKWDFPGIAYGGDYNPEQWDEKTIIEDYRLMQKAGVNLVSIGIFSWAKIEPTPGEYQLDWLAEIIEGLYNHGVYVDLATATASPPVWMAIDNPDTLPLNRTGTRLGFGSRQQYCPNSPYYREKATALVEKLAERFGTHPAVKLWHINNELGNHVPSCYCDNCETAFRSWLEKRYKNIDKLNETWGTNFWSQTYQSFKQISLPREMPAFPNPSQKLDYRRFMSDSYLELYQLEYDTIRRYSPEVPITTNFMGLFDGVNYQKWAEQVDVVADDSYPDPANPAGCTAVALEADLCRSYHGAPFLLMEQAPVGAIQWRGTNSPKRPGQHRLWSLQRMAHGADGILHFQWRQSRRGAEMFHAAMVPHSGEDSRIFREICQLGRELKALQEVQGYMVETPIALIWDWESEWCRKYAVGPRRQRFAEGLRDWHRSCFEAGYATDIISLQKGVELEKYRVIIVPEVFAMKASQIRCLRQAAEAGAQILVVAPSCVVDENLGAHLDNLIGPLGDLVGVRVIEHWVSSSVDNDLGIGPDRTWCADTSTVNRVTCTIGAPSAETDIYLKIEPAGEKIGLGVEKYALSQFEKAISTQRISAEAGKESVIRVDFSAGSRAAEREKKVEKCLKGRYWAELLEVEPHGEANFGKRKAKTPYADEVEIEGVGEGDLQILATYSPRGAAQDIAARPAFTKQQVGRGAAWYLSSNLDAVGRLEVLEAICSFAQVEPPIADFLRQIKSDGVYPAGLEVVDRGPYRFLLNHGDNTVILEGIYAYEVINQIHIDGTVLLGPRDVMVVKKPS